MKYEYCWKDKEEYLIDIEVRCHERDKNNKWLWSHVGMTCKECRDYLKGIWREKVDDVWIFSPMMV